MLVVLSAESPAEEAPFAAEPEPEAAFEPEPAAEPEAEPAAEEPQARVAGCGCVCGLLLAGSQLAEQLLLASRSTPV